MSEESPGGDRQTDCSKQADGGDMKHAEETSPKSEDMLTDVEYL